MAIVRRVGSLVQITGVFSKRFVFDIPKFAVANRGFIFGYSKIHSKNIFSGRVSLPLAVACASEKIPDIPQPPPLQEIVPSLNALGEPTFASLGLNSYWPSGWYQSLLEVLHVNLDLPWWAAIATTTIVIRLCLIPLIIDQRRKLASYTNVMPKIVALQNRMTKARINSNYIEMMKVSQEMQELMKNNDVNPLNSLRLMVVQVPIFLSVFAGLRGMAQLPVDSLKTGGLGWFVDLTVCDPFYILPFYSMASIFLMFEFGADVSSQGLTPAVRVMMRGFPIVGFFMIMHMPSVSKIKCPRTGSFLADIK
uniref:Mitochondrial inner membrane protein OXA1L n=1 Tax=Mesocestoides corti TaxID=53468 RepID=A0A5K3FJS6_MESCO